MSAVILDIDGTLIESMTVDTAIYFAAVREILGDVRRRPLDDYEHVTDSGILATLLRDNERAQDSAIEDAVKSRFLDGLRRHIDREGPLPAIDGAIEFVDRLRASTDYHVAFATGGWRESAQLKLETSGFNIDGIPLASSNDAPARVDIMRHALRSIGTDLQAVTYFGDAAWDRRACRELGWRFVAVGPGLDGLCSFRGFSL